MRKKLQVAFMVIGMGVLFNGCMSQDTDLVQDEETTSGQKHKNTTMADSESTIQDIPEFSGVLDFDYVYETDAQTEIGTYSTCVYTMDGKYYMQAMENSNSSLLFFYDNATGQSVPVCSKSNCLHNAEGCDAYFSEEQYSLNPTFWYYEDSLYIQLKDGDYLYFEKINLDGSTREKAGTIARWEEKVTIHEDGTQSIDVTFPVGKLHRGYFYFTNYTPGSENVKLFRSKLGSNEEPEVVYTVTGERSHLLRISPYGRYVLFQMGHFSDDYIGFSGGIYAYDTEMGTISLVCDNAIRNFIVAENSLYYCDLENNIYCKDLKTGEEKIFYETTESEELYSVSLFSVDAGVVYQVLNTNTGEIEKQLVLSYDGEEQECLDFYGEKHEVIEQKKIQPYSFLAKN